MQPLSKGLRNQLGTHGDDRSGGCRGSGTRSTSSSSVLESPAPMSICPHEEKGLRQRLRPYGRNLGDKRDPERTTQSIDRLVEDVAYQHWHRHAVRTLLG